MEYIIEVAQKEDLHAILKLQKESYLSEAILHNEFNIPPLTQTYESIIEEFDKGFINYKITFISNFSDHKRPSLMNQHYNLSYNPPV